MVKNAAESTLFPGLLVGIGGVVITGIVGAGLAWLRLRTDSLAAPVLVHIAANSASYFAAFAIARWL